MKKFARALALVTGLALLAGCDALSQNWLPMAADHRPEVKTTTVNGFVEDSAGNVIPGAMVSNGASVTFTGTDGAFTLTNVRTGIQYLTATFDHVKSSPVQIEVRSDKTNMVPKIVIVGANRPVSDRSTSIKLVQVFPDSLIASYSVEIASGSASPSFGATRYSTGRDVTLSLAAPPNGSGLAIQSYMVTYEGSTAPTLSADFPQTMKVEPGSLTESGPTKNLILKNVGPSSVAFSEALAASGTGVVEATITLYTEDKSKQAADTTVPMHAPVSGDKDAAQPFKAKVYIQRAER